MVSGAFLSFFRHFGQTCPKLRCAIVALLWASSCSRWFRVNRKYHIHDKYPPNSSSQFVRNFSQYALKKFSSTVVTPNIFHFFGGLALTSVIKTLVFTTKNNTRAFERAWSLTTENGNHNWYPPHFRHKTTETMTKKPTTIITFHN